VANAVDQARRLLEARLAELRTEEQTLRSALDHLEGSSGRNAKSSGRPRRRKGARRAARGQRREELLAAVKEKPGAPVAELARVVGISPNQVRALIRKAQADKLVVKRGKGYAVKK
jgi:Transposase.